MSGLPLLETLPKLLVDVSDLLKCGGSCSTLLPSLIFVLGVALEWLVMVLYYQNYVNCNYLWILLVEVLSFLLVQTLQSSTDDGRGRLRSRRGSGVVSIAICTLVALIPHFVAFHLYRRHRARLNLVRQFEEIVRSTVDRRTELGTTHHIQGIQMSPYKPAQNSNMIRSQSCPNLHAKSF